VTIREIYVHTYSHNRVYSLLTDQVTDGRERMNISRLCSHSKRNEPVPARDMRLLFDYQVRPLAVSIVQRRATLRGGEAVPNTPRIRSTLRLQRTRSAEAASTRRQRRYARAGRFDSDRSASGRRQLDSTVSLVDCADDNNDKLDAKR